MTLEELKPAFDCWCGRVDCTRIEECQANNCPLATKGEDCSETFIKTLDAMISSGRLVEMGKAVHKPLPSARSGKAAVHERICKGLTDLYEKKNADYGDSFSKVYQEYGLMIALAWMQVKMNRLKSLLKNDRQVLDESMRDTVLDLANYAIMTAIEMEVEE